MTPAQFSAALARLGLKNAAAAELLGVNGRTIRRWVTGERSVPGPARRFLEHLAAEKKSKKAS